ncbi:hypothetical protein AMTRI_Chr01g126930 [Amborella trichopoda]
MVLLFFGDGVRELVVSCYSVVLREFNINETRRNVVCTESPTNLHTDTPHTFMHVFSMLTMSPTRGTCLVQRLVKHSLFAHDHKSWLCLSSCYTYANFFYA